MATSPSGTENSKDRLKGVIRDFRREQVIDVARQLFGERGSIDVSMDEIASRAGVARSTVYVYFANRDELVRACLESLHSHLVAAVAASWESEPDITGRLRLLIDEMLARVDDAPAFIRMALVTQEASGRGGDAIRQELATIGLNIARLLRGLCEEGMTQGIFRPMDPDLATSLIGQQIYGAMAVRAAEPLPAERSTTVGLLTDFIVHGLGA